MATADARGSAHSRELPQADLRLVSWNQDVYEPSDVSWMVFARRHAGR
jgi:hypothetical protein